MTKMADMPKYGKNPLKSSPKPAGQLLLNLIYSIWDSGPTSCSNDDPDLNLTYFMPRWTLPPNTPVWKNAAY